MTTCYYKPSESGFKHSDYGLWRLEHLIMVELPQISSLTGCTCKYENKGSSEAGLLLLGSLSFPFSCLHPGDVQPFLSPCGETAEPLQVSESPWRR